MAERNKAREAMTIDYEPKEAYFAVRVQNDDMINAHIPPRSIVVFHKQREAQDGDIILALHNGAQVLRYYKTDGNEVYLMGASNNVFPIAVKCKDMFTILGKAVEIRVEV